MRDEARSEGAGGGEAGHGRGAGGRQSSRTIKSASLSSSLIYSQIVEKLHLFYNPKRRPIKWTSHQIGMFIVHLVFYEQ